MNEQIVRYLEEIIQILQAGQSSDAISQELGRPGRQTSVSSLRESETFQKFEQALVDGAIQQDAVIQTLGLIRQIIPLLLVP